MEGGTPEEVEAAKRIARQQPAAPEDLAAQGLSYLSSFP